MRLSFKVTCQLIMCVSCKEAPPCGRDAMAGTSRKLWESVVAPHTPKGRSTGTGCGRRVQVTRRAHAHALDHLRPMRGIRYPPSVRRVVQLDEPQTRKKRPS